MGGTYAYLLTNETLLALVYAFLALAWLLHRAYVHFLQTRMILLAGFLAIWRQALTLPRACTVCSRPLTWRGATYFVEVHRAG